MNEQNIQKKTQRLSWVFFLDSEISGFPKKLAYGLKIALKYLERCYFNTFN